MKTEKEMREKASAMCDTRQEILESMNKPLRVKADWIIAWCKEDARSSLVSRWELGGQINELLDDEKTGGKVYGANSVTKLSKLIGDDPSVLRQAANLQKAYSKREIEDVADMTLLDGITPVSYSHVRQLITIEDKKERQTTLNLVIENCWTSEDLGTYIVSKYGKRSNNMHGRMGKPKGVDAVIKQQLSFVDDFDNRNANVWADDETSITAQIDNLEPTQYTEDLVDKLYTLAKRMRKLAVEADKRADEAEAKYQEVKDALESRLKKVGKVEPDDLDDDDDEDEDFIPAKNSKKRKPVMA